MALALAVYSEDPGGVGDTASVFILPDLSLAAGS